MKVNFKVKMKVTIEFLVEIIFRNDLHFFEKYFTWGNIQPSQDFLDTLYTNTLEEHEIKFNNLAERLKKANLYLQPEKYNW